MNVSKIEIAHALGILLSAVNDQPEKTEIEKKVADIEQLTGLNIDDVAGLYLLANKIAKDNEMGFDDIESTLLKVRTLALKHGDLDEVEDKLNFSHDAIVWWEEHGDDADDMADVWNACKRYDLGDEEVRELGIMMNKYDFDVMGDAYECYELLGDYDCDDAAEVMDIIARHNLTVSDVRNLIEGKAEQNAIVEKYKAIMAIVNPAQVDEASGD